MQEQAGRHFIPSSCGYDAQPVSWGPGARETYSLHYIFKGRGYVEIGGEVHSVFTGQSFMVIPATPIRYYPDRDEPWGYQWIDIGGGEADALIGQTAFSPQTPVSPVFPENEVIPLFRAVAEAEGSYEAIGRLYVLYQYYLKNYPAQTEKQHRPSYVQDAIAYMQANAHRPLSMTDLSDHLNISRAHLYRVFQKELSESPGEYLLSYRIGKACGMLAQTDLSIKMIAYSLGFDSPLYFSRVFSQKMGAPPGQYRKDMRNQQ
jgi:AraC-like DNA-binding protein